MSPYAIGISTQTPLLKFDAPSESAAPRAGGHAAVVASVGYRLTPGGVCRMVLPTVRTLHAARWLRRAHWYSLQPGAPERFDLPGEPVRLHHLQLPPSDLAAYARTKEKLWADLHGLPAPRFDPDDFRFYARYNAFTADALLQEASELDAVYVHDFQLLQVGALLGLAAPAVFRWHVPWDPQRIPPYSRNFFVRAMEDFDSVIVSTRRDLQGLMDAGFRGRARQVYPHIDPADWRDPTRAQSSRLEEEWSLGPDHVLVLLVARMDPMKRQDLAIQAVARLRRRHPSLRLVLVGNGSFSGAKRGGLGVAKADEWRARLQEMVHELGAASAVRFAHWIPDDLLAAAYARADVLLLPSDIEGFGLTVLEAWRYGRIPLVSSGAGAAEIVHDGVSGAVFRSGDLEGLVEALDALLSSSEARERMGATGRETLPHYAVAAAAPREREVLEEAMEGFSRP